jgi:hypothetical protein
MNILVIVLVYIHYDDYGVYKLEFFSSFFGSMEGGRSLLAAAFPMNVQRFNGHAQPSYK